MTDIPHLKFLPDGSYDLSTPERRLAAAEACLRSIASMPGSYGHAYSSERIRDQMSQDARLLAIALKQAREQETARAAISVEELQLPAEQVRHLLWIEDLLLDSDAPLTAAAALSVLSIKQASNEQDGGFNRQMLAAKIARLATRAVRIDTSSARPIHTVDNLTDAQITSVSTSVSPASSLADDCALCLGEEEATEAQIVEARERIAAELNERRLLAVVAQ